MNSHLLCAETASNSGGERSRRALGSGPVSWLVLAATLLALAFGQRGNSGVEFQRLKSFGFGDQGGQYPAAPLLLGTDGAIYGTTSAGGLNGAGTVFKVNPDGSGYTVLHTLGPGGDRGRPQSGVMEGSDGSLYGMTASGGATGQGTAFKLNKDGTGYAVLHSFGQFTDDGKWGAGELVEGDDGALYGVTYIGGVGGMGTVFRIEKDGGGYAILRSFMARVGGMDGGTPRAGLVKGSDGVLYGTTTQGGRSGVGTVFKLKQDGSDYAVLYSFGDIPDDGFDPQARLGEGSDGFLYGTTLSGGAGPVGNFGMGNGAVYRIGKDGTGYALLHRFTSTAGDGGRPLGSLVEGADGSLLGTASEGGTNRIGTGSGVVFSLGKDGTGYRIVHTFGWLLEGDGGRPSAGLVQDDGGMLFGTTQVSGSTAGSVFKLKPDGSAYENIVRFGLGSGDGIRPRSALLEGQDGALYGTTSYGGSNIVGTVYRMNRNGRGYAILHHFPAFEGDGWRPEAALVEDDKGVLYGTTPCGGQSHFGTVFRMNKDGSGYAVLHHFTLAATNAFSYGAPVTLGGVSGNTLYGTTSALGAYGQGTVFRIERDGSGFRTLHEFSLAAWDGIQPEGVVIEASNGVLYGTTRSGGLTFGGTVFKINPDGTGYSVVHYFDAMQRRDEGAEPIAGVIEGTDGALYGATSSAGASGRGTVFKMQKDGTGFVVLHPLSGARIEDSLVEGSDGTIYGVTRHGGVKGGGTAFRVNKDGSGYAVLVEFGVNFPELTSPDGSEPMGPLMLGSDGALYGTTMHGGDMPFPGYGTVFRLLRAETPRLTTVRLSDGKVEVGVTGKPGCKYQLMRSTDLDTWADLTTITMPEGGTAVVLDDTSATPAACYRALWQP